MHTYACFCNHVIDLHEIEYMTITLLWYLALALTGDILNQETINSYKDRGREIDQKIIHYITELLYWQ